MTALAKDDKSLFYTYFSCNAASWSWGENMPTCADGFNLGLTSTTSHLPTSSTRPHTESKADVVPHMAAVTTWILPDAPANTVMIMRGHVLRNGSRAPAEVGANLQWTREHGIAKKSENRARTSKHVLRHNSRVSDPFASCVQDSEAWWSNKIDWNKHTTLYRCSIWKQHLLIWTQGLVSVSSHIQP